MFRPVNREQGRVVLIPCATGQTINKGDALTDNGSGLLVPATSSTAVDIKYIADESVVTSGTTLVRCYKVDESVRILADVDAAAAQTDVHTYADLASVSTVNPDASTNDLFYIESIDLTAGAVGTSTKVFGYFTNGVPNS